ncbi:CDP-glycerol glycerophosphotransferase family protein [Geomonas silvestris]|uniref:CDP-glycerol glycerophosphotransferase family protein n=1 Tax=Geomonas silvestris TaxID=2740184 RepID=UPI00161C281E|nr:CDP-glycerol glycerophosphotransferase family protein [Geomonas silvestris]
MMSLRWKKHLVPWLEPIWQLLGTLVPKDPRVVAVNAFPDYDDSTRALARAARKHSLHLLVLTCQKGAIPPDWLQGEEVTQAYRYSLRGIFLYHRARYVIFTHGCFSFFRPHARQTVTNIWHGMPLKRIGFLDGKDPCEVPRFTYTLASDSRYRSIMARAFGVDESRVLVADHPRSDLMRDQVALDALTLPPHRLCMVWMPTYRTAVVGDSRSDGDRSADIFSGAVDLGRLDALFARHGVVCLVKPHPMARADRSTFDRYSSIVFVDDAELVSRNLSLYQLLGASHCLITDISSVYFEYQTLGKPMILYCPDLKQFDSSRGFVAPLAELVQHPIVEDEEVLLETLQRMLSEGGFLEKARGEGDGCAASSALLRRLGAVGGES